ncbi:hypothetical protein CBW65_07975 [Tumebacillus avium]|uniref:Uncharacterized protein n=1 Tax=Tumebacillus avium TaxID=1903704 RepID=A0A1Y0INC7_9BACL|nr:hypothetical protein [Tumebacillus avium]ARU61025.1 hypothetical protein CBW65_07975 [Tumebacillus avium]
MRKHTADVCRVFGNSYLVVVDGQPIYQTQHAFTAGRMAERLQRVFDEARRLDGLTVSVQEGRYAVRSAETVILEVDVEESPYAWLQASVLVENLRQALQQNRQTGDVVQLPFQPVTVIHKDVQEVKVPVPNPSAEEHLPELDVLLESFETDVGTVAVYRKRMDRENVYAGLITAAKVYDLVPISNMLSWDQTSAQVIRLVGEDIPFLRIQGVVGANNVRTIYYRMDREFPEPVLEVDGSIVEIDLDNDGKKEIVLSSGIPPLTITFMWAEDRFQEAFVNLTLKANAVTFNPETKLFDAYFTPPDETRPEPEKKTYKYENGKLIEVPTTPA